MSQNGTKKCTIYDVAAKAGVSAATVSRVLANSGYPVSAELRRRIQDAAADLKYTPNAVGRMLKKNDGTDIGVIIPTISNPYYSALLLGAEQEARSRGYNLFLCNSLRDANTEHSYLKSLYQKQVRGIMVSTVTENHDLLRELMGHGVAVVAFDQDIESLQCGRVGFDYARGATLAVEHLIQNGHRDIAFLSAPFTKQSRRDMLDGYRRALAAHGISREFIVTAETEEELHDGTYEFDNGKRLAAKYLTLPRRPTAILAVNDLTAFGILQELFANGVSVPGNVSVMGFDNIELSSMVNPPLSTVEQPAFETGRLACRMLLDAIGDGERNTEPVILQPRLVERQSVRRIN